MKNKLIYKLDKDRHYGIGFDFGITPDTNSIIDEPKAIICFSVRLWNREFWVEWHLG